MCVCVAHTHIYKAFDTIPLLVGYAEICDTPVPAAEVLIDLKGWCVDNVFQTITLLHVMIKVH